MKRLIAALALTILACLATAPFLAAGKPAAADVTLTGEVLDLACYIGHGAKGPDHAGCAQKCLDAGQPAGLAASDGKVYILMADHADPGAYTQAKSMAGKKVEIKGEVADKDGMHGITVHAVKAI